MKKIVIFDLDGTLTNTLKSIQKGTNEALVKYGLEPFELDCFRYFVGDGVDELIRRALDASKKDIVQNAEKTYGKDELFSLVKKEYLDLFEKYCNYEVYPYNGIIELIHALKEKGLFIAVNTNKPQDRSEDVIASKFGKDVFHMIVGQIDERPRKPAPDGVQFILETLNVKKEDAIYIGDTCVDMKTGKSAGVFTVGALWGFRDQKELEEYHADAIISHPMELLDYIG